MRLFEGQTRNTFDMACHEGVRSNVLTIPTEQLRENFLAAIKDTGIDEETASLDEALDFCIEMETGTGKTLVYLKTAYELCRQYAFTKFIIIVPSVAIKEGVLSTFDAFKRQLADVYGFAPACFEYDSKRLNRVTAFVEEQHPQIMVMTLQSFNAEERILNQAQREDLFFNMPFIEAIAHTCPIVIMDEPQEGMDTENAVARIDALKPLCRLRYSATHKIMRNLVYRLTPFRQLQTGPCEEDRGFDRRRAKSGSDVARRARRSEDISGWQNCREPSCASGTQSQTVRSLHASLRFSRSATIWNKGRATSAIGAT